MKEFNAQVKKYAVSDTRKAVTQICTSFIPYVALWCLMVWSLQTHYWVTIALSFLAAGFMVRIFIIQHDCGHGSFFSSRKANHLVGSIFGVLTLTPYTYWKKSHSRHHATSSDLDYRGEGDIWTLTVDEYRQRSLWGRIGYRLYRSPFVMFVVGGPFVTLIRNRFPWREKSVMLTNLALVVLGVVAWFIIGWKSLLMIQLPILIIAANIGVWLFYVQHQFADTYWAEHDKWEFILSGTEGASYYKLPRIFQWFSGNIGFHHLHHLRSRIPFYHLPKAHKTLPHMESIPVMTLLASLKTMNKVLWDPVSNRLVSFRQAKAA